MKIYRIRTKDNYELPEGSLSCCIGYFDGIHLGHQELIKKTVNEAKEKNLIPCLITFEPDPWVTIKGIKDVKHITDMHQRIKIAQSLGIEAIIILDFTKEMSSLSKEDFKKLLLDNLNIKVLVCGFDFHYGFKGEGNVETLKDDSYDLFVVDSINDSKGKISSTRICDALENGQIEEANSMLGHNYTIFGKITKGFGNGKRIGFPTANIKCEDEYIIPKVGVYAGYIRIQKVWHKAMINIGNNPTFNLTDNITIEAHILDFDDDVYDEESKLEFVYYLRDEKKYPSLDKLVEQLKIDVAHTSEMLKDHE